MEDSQTQTIPSTFPANEHFSGEVVATPSGGGAPVLPPAGAPFARFHADEPLIRGWRRLEACASLPTQSHGFAAALASTLTCAEACDAFAVPAADGGIAALLPLFRCAGRFARWRTLGEPVFEPVDALVRDAAALRRLADLLAAQPRALDLERIPAGSPLIPALTAAFKGKGWVSVRPAVSSPTLALDPGWIDPPSRFNSGRRSDFRRAARRAAELGRVSHEVLSPGPGDFDALFDEAIAVEQRSWKAEAGSALAVDRDKQDFFRAYFRAAAESGAFRLAFLHIDGKVVAMQMGLEWQDRFWLFKIGFDEAYARCSPGTLLMLRTIGWAAQRGLARYELLGNVEPWIARFWTSDAHPCVRLRTYRFNLHGAVAFAGDALVWLRAALRRKAR